jgi:hypothetical protein
MRVIYIFFIYLCFSINFLHYFHVVKIVTFEETDGPSVGGSRRYFPIFKQMYLLKYDLSMQKELELLHTHI